jgi:sortase A
VITHLHTNTPERASARAVRLAARDPSATREDLKRLLQGDFTPRRQDAKSETVPPRFASWRLGVSLPFLFAAILIAIGLAFAGHGLCIRAKAIVAQILLEQAWEATIATGHPTKAWAWADTWPVARISFPRLNRSAIVMREGGGEALAFGPAHVAASAMPGQNGVSVIAGHRDTHFSFIKDLKAGDEILVTTVQGTTVRYRMTGSAIVHAQSSGIATSAATPRLALVTCYPFDGLQRGPLRYVLFAERQNSPIN